MPDPQTQDEIHARLEILKSDLTFNGVEGGKRLSFIEHYLKTWVGRRATKAAGYAGDDHQLTIKSGELLRDPRIQEYIHLRLLSVQMSADEVLYRLALQARGNMGDFYKILDDGTPQLDLKTADEYGLLAILKKLKPTTLGWEIELHDAQSALAQIGKFHSLWTERIVTEDGLESASIDSLEDRAGRLATILESARDRRDRSAPNSEPAVEPEVDSPDPGLLQSSG